MQSWRTFSLVLCAAILLGCTAAGCSRNDSSRSILQVVEINGNNPLQSDVLKLADGGGVSVMEDAVPVEVSNEPHDANLQITPDGPYGYVTLDRYQVDFESTEQIPPVGGTLGWTVHTGETIKGNLVVVPGVLKMQPPLVSLAQGGEILAIAHVIIYGHEATSNHALEVRCTLQVNFANWQDS